MQKNNRQYIPQLDVLRGVAILMVFFYHTQLCIFRGYEIQTYTANGTLDVKTWKDTILNFSPFAFGWLGVELFLVISGFVIHYGFLISRDTFSIKGFYVKRFFRIYPPYFVILLFLIILRAFTFSGENMLQHVLLIHNFFSASFYSINPSFWSLALEVQLYIAYPLFLALRKRIGIKKTVGLLVALHFICTLTWFVLTKGRISPFLYSVPVLWFTWGAGALVAELYLEKKKLFQKNHLILFIIFIFLIPVSKYTVFGNLLTVFISICAWVALLEWFLHTKWEEKLFVKLLFKLLGGLGICSYSIYLIHQPYLCDLLVWGNMDYNIMRLIVNPLASLLIIVLISYSLYVFVEQPSVALGKKIWKKYANK